MFTDKFSAMFLGPEEVKIEAKSTELEHWGKSVMASGRKVATEEVENPSCMGLDHSRYVQPGMGKANI